jgi:hypothetical protein
MPRSPTTPWKVGELWGKLSIGLGCLDNLDLNGASVVNAKLSRSREIVIASAAKQSRWRRVCPVGIASSLRSSQ